jgi:hypothetical protein
VKTKTIHAAVLFLVVAFAAALAAAAGPSAPAPAVKPVGKMPGTLILGSIADRYPPVKFDHGKHVGMASGCAECHHQHDGGTAASCGGCHKVDPAAFRKNVNLAKIRPCGECHPTSWKADRPGLPTLKAAYHRACIRCHKDVGSVGKDPKGCAELCHESSAQARAR